MPTMLERLAVVETEVATIKETTSDTHSDVKELLSWRDEERGARKQRNSYVKYVAIGLTIVTIGTNIALRFI